MIFARCSLTLAEMPAGALAWACDKGMNKD
jgi:hypothetical protein